MQRCERFRRNNYVGSPIWGFRVPPGTQVGDQLFYDDDLFDPPHRSHYVVGEVDGRLACLWADHWDHQRGRNSFAGFID